MSTLNASVVARQLKISERHARRLLRDGDPRVAPVADEWMANWRRQRAAEGLQTHLARLITEVASLNVFLDRENPEWAPAARSALVKIQRAIAVMRDLVPMT